MNARKSLAIYPRVDSMFRGKHSFNFDMMKSEIYQNQDRPKRIKAYIWLGYFFTGFLTGLIAFLMSQIEEFLVEHRSHFMQTIIDNYGNQILSSVFAVSFCFVFACVASALTVYVGPGANGSGIAELMAIFNGVNYPNFIGKRTLFVKIVAVILAISGFLCVGKEGPLAHIGAVTAMIVVYYLPISKFDYFKNDVVKREFMAAGTSAGVAAAFAAPIGSALFSYELSKPTTFWTFSMIWRVFFCSSVSTFTLSLLSQIKEHGFDNLTLVASGTLKFGDFQNIQDVKLRDVHGPIFIGIIGGLMGSLFVNVNTRMTALRKKYITTNARKILETGFYAVLTMTVAITSVVIVNNCDKIERSKVEADDFKKILIRWQCPEEAPDSEFVSFSPLATLFFNTEGGTIRSLFVQEKEN